MLSSLFAYYRAGKLNVVVKGAAELATGECVSGDFFEGLAVSPAAGRLLLREDDRANAPLVAVISMGYSQRRFGGPPNATGQRILINNVPFTVISVTPSEFFGVDPGATPPSISRCRRLAFLFRMPRTDTSTRTTTGSR